ncbi:hypothetical protein HGRIS_007394 [Hohenbuehelia grisea]|uniref:Uncharacterized protein n=1 Tax=Hohenbuehelia grisea TaxID=104357 RepID=A0ABR3J4N7_9AGAR
MWCTRWFLPLLLLPLPTAPPYFLLLFLISLTMHAKPCFYCIILLSTLFISSCYWQPFPLDSSLSVPWSENITTFSEALNATISLDYQKPLPSVLRAVDRCWCDFSTNGLFEPYNVSHWERVSVEKLKAELERKVSEEILQVYNEEKRRQQSSDREVDQPEADGGSSLEPLGSATDSVSQEGGSEHETSQGDTPKARRDDMPRTLAPNPSTPPAPSLQEDEVPRYRSLWDIVRPLLPRSWIRLLYSAVSSDGKIFFPGEALKKEEKTNQDPQAAPGDWDRESDPLSSEPASPQAIYFTNRDGQRQRVTPAPGHLNDNEESPSTRRIEFSAPPGYRVLPPIDPNVQQPEAAQDDPTSTAENTTSHAGHGHHTQLTLQPAPPALPWIRKEYDLRPYGLSLILDFSWSRSA